MVKEETTEYVSEEQLGEIVKKYVQKPIDESDREMKMMVLSLVSDLRNCRAERDQLKGEVERMAQQSEVSK
jgi:hypothetical protein